MIFDINQREFPSTVHKSIWHAAVFMSPFCEVIPPGLKKNEEDDLREGEKNFYSFILDLYSHMYNNPNNYYIPIEHYDNYMKNRKSKKLHHKGDPKESNLRNKFQQSVQFYQKLLFGIGANAELDVDSFNLCMDKSLYFSILKKLNLSKIRGEEEMRAASLSYIGLEILKSEDKVVISNSKYPKMLIALSALCKSDNKKYAFTNFLRCDFRGLNKSYKPGLDDVISILPKNLKQIVTDMDEFIQNLNCKFSVQPLKNTTLHNKWKVSYNKNGKSVYAFHSDIESLVTFLYFNYHENISRIGYELKKEPDLLYTWYYDRIPASQCSCVNSKLVDIGGQKKRICGLMNRLEVTNPVMDDLEKMKKVLEIYQSKNIYVSFVQT